MLDRTRSLFRGQDADRPSKALEEELARLEGSYEIFKIQLFQEYRRHVRINSVVALALSDILVVISYMASAHIGDDYQWLTVLMCMLSLLPAPITLAVLWVSANKQVMPIKNRADNLESRCLQPK